MSVYFDCLEPVRSDFVIGCFPLYRAHEAFKGSAHLIDHLMDPTTNSSVDPNTAPFNRAFNTPNLMFEWFEEPGNETKRNRFQTAMRTSAAFLPPDLVTGGEYPVRHRYPLIFICSSETLILNHIFQHSSGMLLAPKT